MHVDVRGIEAVGERARESCGCGVAAGSATVGGYAVGSEAGGVAAWESTAAGAVECRFRYRYQRRNGASG